MILLLAAQALPVPAPPPRPQSQPPATMVVEPVAMAIAAADADRDARTSGRELDAFIQASFPAATGYLGFADWAERWLGDRNALPSPLEVDADGDNRITTPELLTAMRRVFVRLDRNQDGFVTRAEALTIRASAGGPGNRGRGERSRPPSGQ